MRPTSDKADTGGDGNGFEVRPDLAYLDKSGYAQNMDGVGDRHNYWGYGINLPAGSRVSGIEVRLDWWSSATTLSPRLGVELSWDSGTTWTSIPKETPPWSKNERRDSLGGATDAWGRSWSAEELGDSSFRVRVTSLCSDEAQCGSYDYFLDWLAVQVTYTAGTVVATATPTATSTPAGTSTPTPIPSPTPDWTPGVTPTATWTPTATATGTPVPTATPVPVVTGWLRPTGNGADSGGDGNGFEVSPDLAYLDKNGYAQNVDGAEDRHLYSGYGVNLPAGSRISGIEVRLDWWSSATTLSPQLGVDLSWDGGTSWTTMRTTPPARKNERSDFLGSSTDVWGRAWSAAELGDGSFLVRVTSLCSGDIQCASYDYFLDWIAVTVHFTP